VRLYFFVGLVCLGFCVSVAPAAAGSIPLRDRGPANKVLADGDRWLVVEQPGKVVATDTRTGPRVATSVDSSCRPIATHAGLLLLSCATPTTGQPPRDGPGPYFDSYERPVVIRLRTGRTAAVLNTTQTAYDVGNGAQSWSGVGTQWISGDVACYHCEGTRYVNWHTGESRFDSEFYEAQRARDLDDPKLGPARHRGDPAPLTPPTDCCSALTVVTGSHALVLSSRPYGCNSVITTADRYIWSEGRGPAHRTLHAYFPRSRKRVTWTVPRDVPGLVATIVMTRESIAALVVPPSTDGQKPGRVVTARWP
jgi:hypothetical protein